MHVSFEFSCADNFFRTICLVKENIYIQFSSNSAINSIKMGPAKLDIRQRQRQFSEYRSVIEQNFYKPQRFEKPISFNLILSFSVFTK